MTEKKDPKAPGIVMNLHIPHERQRQYLSYPLDIPANTDRVDIRYAFPRRTFTPDGAGGTLHEEINIVDIALEDEDHRLIGASGSARMDIHIHENYASPGYWLGRPIPKATWYVVLGAYKIHPDGCDVRLEITFTAKSRRLLVGETHSHTIHSDGRNTPQENIALAKNLGLDFLCMTDHNTTTQNAYAHSDEALTVIPGMEATYYDGHCNFLGVHRPIGSYVAHTREGILSNMRKARESGALISLNHTFSDCPWLLGFGEDVPYDMIEVWNGLRMDWNLEAIRHWHGLLCQGKRIPICGGSDYHRTQFASIPGAPAMFVYAQSKSASDILAAMREGSGFIGMSPDAPIVDIQTQDGRYAMGQTVPADRLQPLCITASRLWPGDELAVITDRGEEHVQKLQGQYAIELCIPMQPRLFYRVQVLRRLPGMLAMLAAITNPIYIRNED